MLNSELGEDANSVICEISKYIDAIEMPVFGRLHFWSAGVKPKMLKSRQQSGKDSHLYWKIKHGLRQCVFQLINGGFWKVLALDKDSNALTFSLKKEKKKING